MLQKSVCGETKHRSKRIGELRFIMLAGPEELTLLALSPKQRSYRAFRQCITPDFSGQCWLLIRSDQIRSVTQLCPTLCDPMNCSTPGLPVHHQRPEFTQTHVHRVSDAIQPSHPLSSPSPPAPNPSQHHSLFQWVNSSHQVAKVLEFQL